MYSTYDIKKISGHFRTLHSKNLHSFYKSLKCNLQENFVEAAAWKTGKEKCLRISRGWRNLVGLLCSDVLGRCESAYCIYICVSIYIQTAFPV